MRPDIIVIVAPSGNFAPSFSEARKYFLIQKLVAQPPVERLDKCVLRRLYGRDVMPGDAAVVLPFEDGATRALCFWVDSGKAP